MMTWVFFFVFIITITIVKQIHHQVFVVSNEEAQMLVLAAAQVYVSKQNCFMTCLT